MSADESMYYRCDCGNCPDSCDSDICLACKHGSVVRIKRKRMDIDPLFQDTDETEKTA